MSKCRSSRDQINSLKSLLDFTLKVQFMASWELREEESPPVTTSDSNIIIMRKTYNIQIGRIGSSQFHFSCAAAFGASDKIGISGRDEFPDLLEYAQ